MVGPDAAADAVASSVDRKIGWVREAAGDRFDDLELNCLTFLTIVTDDRAGMAEKLAPVFGIDPAEVPEIPHAFVGSVDEICEDLERRRERWGLSYFVVQGDGMDALAPVVARMAGTLSTELAFAGAGHISVVHALAAQALAGVTVVGPVASRTPARAAERAGQVGGRAVTYDQLPDGADVVVVATPPTPPRPRRPGRAGGRRGGDRGEAAWPPRWPTPTPWSRRPPPTADRLGYAENLAFAPIVHPGRLAGRGPWDRCATSTPACSRVDRTGATS